MQKLTSGIFDELAYTLTFVSIEIIHHYRLAGPEGRNKKALDVDVEGNGVR